MFQVGKKVICIKDHSNKIVTKGQVFELQGIKKNNCSCNYILLDIGVRTAESAIVRCIRCGRMGGKDTSTMWFGSSLFAPYDDTLSTITADELIEQLELQIV